MIVSNATLYKKLVSKPTTEIENRYSGTGNKKHKHKLKLKDNKSSLPTNIIEPTDVQVRL